MMEADEPLSIGTPVVYWGSIPEYHGELYTVVLFRRSVGGSEWRYDLKPMVSHGEYKELYGARRQSLAVI